MYVAGCGKICITTEIITTCTAMESGLITYCTTCIPEGMITGKLYAVATAGAMQKTHIKIPEHEMQADQSELHQCYSVFFTQLLLV